MKLKLETKTNRNEKTTKIISALIVITHDTAAELYKERRPALWLKRVTPQRHKIVPPHIGTRKFPLTSKRQDPPLLGAPPFQNFYIGY